jgi:hypothetical protein
MKELTIKSLGHNLKLQIGGTKRQFDLQKPLEGFVLTNKTC